MAERYPGGARMVSIARGRRAPLMPSEVWAFVTAFSAYSICTSLPEGLNVVSEYEYADSPMLVAAAARQRWAPPRPQLSTAGNASPGRCESVRAWRFCPALRRFVG